MTSREDARMERMAYLSCVVLLVVVGFASSLAAQTSTRGTGVDVEIYDPATGTNDFCVAPGDSFWVSVFVRPGSQSQPCSLACGSTAGGTGAVATAVLDLQFDSRLLAFEGAESNPDSAAVDGQIQLQNIASGRLGWALAGDWTPDATPSPDAAALADPCAMGKLTTAGWVFRARFRLTTPTTSTALRLRRATEDGFPLSFADACGRPFREANGLVDEVVDAHVDSVCPEVMIFTDGFETGAADVWTVPAT